MDQMCYTNLIELIKQGYFKQCCSLIKKQKCDRINEPHSLKLLVVCVNNLGTIKINTALEFKWLVEFLNHLEFSGPPKEKSLTTYIQSLYHLLNYLLKQEKFDAIVKIENIIVPQCFPKDINDEQFKYYRSCATLLLKNLKSLNKKVKSFEKIVQIVVNLEVKYNSKNFVEFMHKVFYDLGNSLSSGFIDNYLHILHFSVEGIKFSNKNFLHFFEILKIICKTRSADKNIHTIDETIKGLHKNFTLNQNEAGILVIDYMQTLLPLMQKPIVNYSSIENLEGIYNAAHVKFKKCLQFQDKATVILYLEQVVSFYLFYVDNLQNGEIQSNRCMQLNDLKICISHLKSQASLLSQKDLISKCCCKVTKDFFSSVKIYLNCIVLIRESLKAFSSENIDELQVIISKLIKSLMENFAILWENSCKCAKIVWDKFGEHVYFLIRQLDTEGLHSVNVQVCKMIAQKIFIYGGDNHYLVNESKTKSLFVIYAQALIKLKMHEEVMKLCMIISNYYPTFRDKFCSIWNSAKFETKSSWTLVELIPSNDQFIVDIIRDSCNKECADKVLSFEIQNYVLKWSDSKSIAKALNTLYKCTSKENYLSVIRKLPLKVFTKLDLIFDNNLLEKEEAVETINVLEEKNSSKEEENHLFEAIKNYFLFKKSQLAAIGENKKKRNILAVPAVKVSGHDGALKDKNDECDLLPHYGNLQFSTYHENVMKHLEHSLNHFEKCSLSPKNDDLLFLDLLLSISYEFTMRCYEKQAKRCAKLTSHVAASFKDSARIVKALTLRVRYMETAQNINELFKFGENQIIHLKEESKAAILCAFYSNFAMAFLRSNQIDKFKETYEKASTWSSSNEMSSDDDLNINRDVAKCHFYLLICKMDLLPCKFITNEIHGDDTLYTRHLSWKLLYQYLKWTSDVDYAELVTLLFDITDDIMQTNFWYRLPREMRAYGKTMIQVAESGMFPYRVAKLLIQLAKADILCLKVPDFEMKLGYLQEILKCDDNLVENFENLRLASTKCGSPLGVNKEYKQPEFSSHPDGCFCIACGHADYQETFLVTIHFRACLEDMQENYKEAATLQMEMHNFYSKLIKKYNFNRKENYLEASLSYVYHLMNRGKYPEVVANIERVVKFQGNSEYRNFYLFNELMAIKTEIQLMQQSIQLAQQSTKNLNVQETVDVVAGLDKTPENKSGQDFKTPCPNFRAALSEVEKTGDNAKKTNKKAFNSETEHSHGKLNRLASKKNLLKDLEANVPEKSKQTPQNKNGKTRKLLMR